MGSISGGVGFLYAMSSPHGNPTLQNVQPGLLRHVPRDKEAAGVFFRLRRLHLKYMCILREGGAHSSRLFEMREASAQGLPQARRGLVPGMPARDKARTSHLAVICRSGNFVFASPSGSTPRSCCSSIGCTFSCRPYHRKYSPARISFTTATGVISAGGESTTISGFLPSFEVPDSPSCVSTGTPCSHHKPNILGPATPPSSPRNCCAAAITKECKVGQRPSFGSQVTHGCDTRVTHSGPVLARHVVAETAASAVRQGVCRISCSKAP